jgi:flavin reductase (DIM6/NTAB) family NADH-FMN oxidoreductase RutF
MLVLVCLHQTSRAVGQIEHAGAFGVSVLSAGQQDISRWFANRHRPAGSAMFDGVPSNKAAPAARSWRVQRHRSNAGRGIRTAPAIT